MIEIALDFMNGAFMQIAIIGGSGLEDRLSAAGLLESAEVVEPRTPFGPPSAPLTIGRLAGTDTRLVTLHRHGTGHSIPPHRVPYRANIFALKALGATHIIATGAVGSLRNEIQPRELVLVDQLIDRTTGAGTRGADRSFFDAAAVHVEFADPCCPAMRLWLEAAASSDLVRGVRVHGAGTYVTIDGPSFSTRAESRMHRALGGDVVGMTALPEARLAREAEIAYALIALPTDYDAWKPHDLAPGQEHESLLREVIGNLHASADAAARLIEAALSDLSTLQERPSPAHEALRLGIWTEKALIPPDEVDRLRPLWGRWFDEA